MAILSFHNYFAFILCSTFFATILSTNGFSIYRGFNPMLRHHAPRRRLFNSLPQSNELVLRNTFYERAIESDLSHVVESLKRIQFLMGIADHLNLQVQEFRFEKPCYNVTTTTGFIGLLTSFKLITTLTSPVQFGLLTNDAYVNEVFRIGPSSGLLYSDTKLKPGVYNFAVTADIIDLQLHATANVTVNVTRPSLGRTLTINAYAIHLYLAGFKRHPRDTNATAEEVTTTQPPETSEGPKIKTFSDIPPEVLGNVNKDDLKNPYSDLWRDIVRQKILTTKASEKTEGEKRLEDQTIPKIKIILPNENRLRFRRAILPKVNTTTLVKTSVTTQFNATVASIKIHQESALADFVMSSFVLFVTTFTSVIFLGSIAYFIYRRLKKCGDYSVDDDVKSVERPPDNDIVMESDMKTPNLLCISEIHQKRVTDSIEITKSKLHGHCPTSIFTIQRSYEEHQAECSGDDDVFIVDMSQLSTGSEDVYNTITLQSFTHSTPAITATLIGGQPPVSILSSSRRSSIVSSKKDGQSLASEEIGPNGETRRKSVTFSDIVELYQIKT